MTACEYPELSVELNSQMTDEYKNCILRLLGRQAYCEIEGAKFYSKWIDRAPGMQERKMVAQIVQEEFEHWTLIVNLMLDLGLRFEDIKNFQKGRLDYALIKLATMRARWTDAVMVAFLIDSAALYGVRDNIRCSYAPWARVCADILEEEEKHGEAGIEFVDQQIRKIGKEKMQKALKKWWPFALNAMGAPVSKNEKTYKRLGFHIRSNEDRRQNFREDFERKIAALNLEVPKLRRETFPYI